MNTKAHGSCVSAVQSNLRYGCDFQTADKICCYNRHYAEYSGYAFTSQHSSWITAVRKGGEANPVTFYGSVTGLPLYKAPVGRSADDLI